MDTTPDTTPEEHSLDRSSGQSPALFPRRGLYFEEFAVGLSVDSPGRTVTETDVVQFAMLSGDWTGIHTDAVYAAQTPVGQRFAHGLLGLAIANGLAVRLGFMEGTTLAFRGLSDWKFSLPILIGDTVHLHLTIQEKRPVPRLNGGMLTLAVELITQDGKIVQSGSWSVLVMSRPA